MKLQIVRLNDKPEQALQNNQRAHERAEVSRLRAAAREAKKARILRRSSGPKYLQSIGPQPLIMNHLRLALPAVWSLHSRKIAPLNSNVDKFRLFLHTIALHER